MGGGHACTFHAVGLGTTETWLATAKPLPAAVRAELAELSDVALDARARRGVGSVAADLGALVASGVIGNAAWEALPLTAAYLRGIFSSGGDSSLDHQAVFNTITAAARSAYGSRAAVHVDRAERLADGSWDVTFAVDGSQLFARVDKSGQLVLWVA